MTGWALVATIVAAAGALMVAVGVFERERRYRGIRLIACPENLQPAAVRLDASDTAFRLIGSGSRPLRLASCSRWPEMVGCDEACTGQIEIHQDSCLALSIVTAWYAGRRCHFCTKPIGAIIWHERPPAVLLANGSSAEWKDLPAEELPAAFATGEAVCWACHIVEGFRTQHPELVVERGRAIPRMKPIEPTAAVY
jgi:hypothetical protein